MMKRKPKSKKLSPRRRTNALFIVTVALVVLLVLLRMIVFVAGRGRHH